MIEFYLLALAGMAAVPLAWLLPARIAPDVVAAWSAAALLYVAPLSALWLAGTVVVVAGAIRIGRAAGRPDHAAAAGTLILAGAFLGLRDLTALHWVGPAYFTLRAIHVLLEWWMGRLEPPGPRALLRYQFFLPVLVAGPIHRLPNFERQLARRRWDGAALAAGAERALLGLAALTVVGGWGWGRLTRLVEPRLEGWAAFPREWLLSALAWGHLYVVFAATTAVALGTALAMGLVLEENFDRPWAARSLTRFWQRWHMTLSHWCRDYVFAPVTGLTRRPILGLGAAMLAIGIWHESSLYYVLWAAWQTAGIALTHAAAATAPVRAALDLLGPATLVTGPLLVLAWLSAARPVIGLLTGVPQ